MKLEGIGITRTEFAPFSLKIPKGNIVLVYSFYETFYKSTVYTVKFIKPSWAGCNFGCWSGKETTNSKVYTPLENDVTMIKSYRNNDIVKLINET